jgi:hypothetical protein
MGRPVLINHQPLQIGEKVAKATDLGKTGA